MQVTLSGASFGTNFCLFVEINAKFFSDKQKPLPDLKINTQSLNHSPTHREREKDPHTIEKL